MDWSEYAQKSAASVLAQLGSSKKGLSPAEARKRLRTNGPNRLPAAHTGQVAAFVKAQCSDISFVLLLGATAIAVYLNNSYAATALLVVIVIHALARTAYLRENQQFVSHLERLLARTVLVIRSGKQMHIDSSELVPGDIVCLEHGDSVPADLRLIETKRFAADSFDVSGILPDAASSTSHSTKAANTVLMGTTVTSGTARGIVTATGSQTRIGQLVGTPAALQAITGIPAKGLLDLRLRLNWVLAGLGALLIICALAGHLGLQDFWLCAAALIVAAIPSELLPALALSRRTAPAATQRIIACALHNVSVKIGLVAVGIFGLLAFHVPLAVTIIELLIIDVVGALLPASALDGDAKTPVATSHLFGFGLFASGLSYANFLLYFQSRGFSPVRIGTGSTLYFQATMLACLTAMLCSFVNVMLIRADEHKRFFTRHIWGNSHLLVAFGLSLAAIIFVIYTPLAHQYLGTYALGLGDWITAVAAALVYSGFRLLQRHTRQHTRQAVIALHHELGLSRSIK